MADRVQSVTSDFDRPLLLFGSHRSGTTWLGSVFGTGRDVAYWSEPRQVWVYGNWFRPDDVLTEADARPEVVRYIKRRFRRFTERQGKRIFCEKTPSNCLRVRFIRAIYPEARYLLILRDARAVLSSTQEILDRGGPRWRRLWERAWEARPWEWPAYLERWPWLVSKIMGRTHPFWGTRPPGWKAWFQQDPPPVFFAKQWAATMRRAFADFQAIPPAQRRIVRYEELLCASEDQLRELVAFSGSADVHGIVQTLMRTRDVSRDENRRNTFADEEWKPLRSELEPTLNLLGYSW